MSVAYELDANINCEIADPFLNLMIITFAGLMQKDIIANKLLFFFFRWLKKKMALKLFTDKKLR